MSFEPDVVSGVCEYMNTNQAAYNLLLVQCLGDARDATEATMVGFDSLGVDFEATRGNETTLVRLPWTHELHTRDEVRADIFLLVERAMQVYEP